MLRYISHPLRTTDFIWLVLLGPRRPGEGVENEEQGILSAEEVPATG